MKAITIQRPWSHCVARGAKLVENRTLPTSHRGPLAIHAGVAWSLRGEHDPRVRGVIPPDELQPSVLWGGVVLAVVELADCHPAAECCLPWGDAEYHGRPVHHWVLTDVRALHAPVLATGRLGLWNVELGDAALSDVIA